MCVSVQDTTTLRYEELLLRDPYSVKQWLAYLVYQHDATPEVSPLQHIMTRLSAATCVLTASSAVWLPCVRNRSVI